MVRHGELGGGPETSFTGKQDGVQPKRNAGYDALWGVRRGGVRPSSQERKRKMLIFFMDQRLMDVWIWTKINP